MFRKSLTTLAAMAMLAAPLGAQAQPINRPAAPAQNTTAAAGPGADFLIALAAVALVAVALAHHR